MILHRAFDQSLVQTVYKIFDLIPVDDDGIAGRIPLPLLVFHILGDGEEEAVAACLVGFDGSIFVKMTDVFAAGLDIPADRLVVALLAPLFLQIGIDLAVDPAPAGSERFLHGSDAAVLLYAPCGIFRLGNAARAVQRVFALYVRHEEIVLLGVHVVLHRREELHVDELCRHALICRNAFEGDPVCILIVDEEGEVKDLLARTGIVIAVEEIADGDLIGKPEGSALHYLGDGVELPDRRICVCIVALLGGAAGCDVPRCADEDIGKHEDAADHDLHAAQKLSQPEGNLKEHARTGAARKGRNDHDPQLSLWIVLANPVEKEPQLPLQLARQNGIHKGDPRLDAQLGSTVYHALSQKFGRCRAPVLDIRARAVIDDILTDGLRGARRDHGNTGAAP